MSDMQPRHAAPHPRAALIAVPVGLLLTALASLCALADVRIAVEEPGALPVPAAARDLPAVQVDASVVDDPCADPLVDKALSGGDDAATVAAFGGAAAFRASIVAGAAPCISLSDPAHVWVVVDKARPLDPLDYAPASLAGTGLTATTGSGTARSDVSAALADLAEAAADAGAGSIGVNNGYRSYDLQVRTYDRHVRERGQEWADTESARAGHSEHQTGLALDIVACDPQCGDIQDFGGTPQSAWVAAHAWEYGFIVRYEDGRTPTTGYVAEPWHLRYIGTELAAEYHTGGFHTLEEFFGVPAAPDYLD